jgi:hypothetical protein
MGRGAASVTAAIAWLLTRALRLPDRIAGGFILAASLGNLQAVPKAENRSFSRTKTGAMKSQKSKREASK